MTLKDQPLGAIVKIYDHFSRSSKEVIVKTQGAELTQVRPLNASNSLWLENDTPVLEVVFLTTES